MTKTRKDTTKSAQAEPARKKGKQTMTQTTEAAKKPLPASKQIGTSIMIPRDKIEVNEKWNVRREYEIDGSTNVEARQSIEDLAADIKSRGQLTPVLVMAQPANAKQPYRLIAGFRRMRAAEALNLAEVRAEVFEGDEQSAQFVNLAENVARKNLQAYEIAMKLVELRDKYKLSGDKMGKLVGCSKGYANNLMRLEDNLIPVLKDRFHSPQCPSIEKLVSLAALSREEQEARWKNFLGIAEDGDGSDTGGGAQAPKTLRPTANQIALAITALTEKVKDDKITKEDAKLAMSCLRWAAGLQATIPGIYDPREPTEPKTPAEPKKPSAKAD